MNEPVLDLRGITRTFQQASEPLQILRGCSLTIHAGETVALIGPSGSGKSTLLHSAGLLEKPDQGQVLIGGRDAMLLDDSERTALRRRTIGFVYQFHHLLPEFSALENIVLPQMIAGVGRKEAERRARDLLEKIGLANRADNRPGKLSGGEQQRVAIARALINEPVLLLADEPTGNLDATAAQEILDLLQQLNEEFAKTIVMVTHDPRAARRAHRMLHLEKGTFVETELDALEAAG